MLKTTAMIGLLISSHILLAAPLKKTSNDYYKKLVYDCTTNMPGDLSELTIELSYFYESTFPLPFAEMKVSSCSEFLTNFTHSMALKTEENGYTYYARVISGANHARTEYLVALPQKFKTYDMKPDQVSTMIFHLRAREEKFQKQIYELQANCQLRPVVDISKLTVIKPQTSNLKGAVTTVLQESLKTKGLIVGNGWYEASLSDLVKNIETHDVTVEALKNKEGVFNIVIQSKEDSMKIGRFEEAFFSLVDGKHVLVVPSYRELNP